MILQFTSLIILNQSLYLTCTLFILGPNFIHGSVELHGGDGEKVDVKVDDNDIKAGSYQAIWTPGAIGGSSKDYGYGIIYINGDQNSIQVEPDKPTDVTFKDGDTITFQFAGNGDNDKLTLDQK
ncbi:hypothetical protein [Limosilactobacillus fermentum]